jgi:splicing suppressor protein 51
MVTTNLHSTWSPSRSRFACLMEGLYTCLRCTRALASTTKQTTRSTLVQQFPKSRHFSSSSALNHAPSSIGKGINKSWDHGSKQLKRVASTSAVPLEEPDNFERHNIPPTDYGEWRAHGRTVLRPDDLFHPFSKSPIPEIRQRARFTKQHALCPHPAHQQTRVPISPHDPESRKVEGQSTQPPAHVNFECPDCGIATYCNEEHWADDYEAHLEICDTLRQINEDDHDLRSGRWFPEFEYPGPQLDEILVNMTSWDTFLYTRQFEAINAERSMRQATRLLTYPLSIGSVLHELSPYDIRRGGRLTTEGLKSFSGMYSKSFIPLLLLTLDSAEIYSPSSPTRTRHYGRWFEIV